MKELSEHILDIAQNSVAAGAARVTVELTEDDRGRLTVVIEDDGCGMAPELLASASDPFTTTRTTRKLGLGLPFYRMTAELTGGSIHIRSAPGEGTTVTAVFDLRHLDCPPMGSIADTIALLIQGNPDIDLIYRHITPRGSSELLTEEMRQVLGEDISLADPAVFNWIRSCLSEQEAELEGVD